MLYKKKPLKNLLPTGSKWEFENPLADLIYQKVDAIYEFRAGRPSKFGICRPEQDLAIMVAYVKTRRGMRYVEDKEMTKKQEDELAKIGKKGKK